LVRVSGIFTFLKHSASLFPPTYLISSAPQPPVTFTNGRWGGGGDEGDEGDKGDKEDKEEETTNDK